MTDIEIKEKIIQELITTINKLTKRSDLIAIVNSYGDTLENNEILVDLIDWNIKN